MEWLDWVANQWWGSYRRRWRTKTLLLLETAHLVQAKIETKRRCGGWWRQRLNVAITCTTCICHKRCTSGTSSMAASWSNSRHESSQAILPLRGSHYERIRSHLHHPFKPSRAYLAPPLLLQQIQIQIQNHLHLLFRLVKAVLQWDSFRQKRFLKCAQERGSLRVGLAYLVTMYRRWFPVMTGFMEFSTNYRSCDRGGRMCVPCIAIEQDTGPQFWKQDQVWDCWGPFIETTLSKIYGTLKWYDAALSLLCFGHFSNVLYNGSGALDHRSHLITILYRAFFYCSALTND